MSIELDAAAGMMMAECAGGMIGLLRQKSRRATCLQTSRKQWQTLRPDGPT
jgi:uncharacterized membrane protein YhiD involved in acid resistance